jgi:hypothetical protein
VQDLPRSREHLAGDEERDQDLGHPGELPLPGHQVVLVATVRVPRRVGVVLEQEHVPGDALLVQADLGSPQEGLEDTLPRLVVGHQVEDRIALRRGVLGMGANVEVQAGAVLQEHV